MRIGFLLLGALFGFLLSRAGATNYDNYANLFLFVDFQLLWVIATAIGTGIIGITIMRWLKAKTIVGAEPLDYQGRPYRKALIVGSFLFGVGWAVSGSCPGTAPAMLGEGKLVALFAIIGIMLGTYIYGLWMSKLHKSDTPGDSGSPGSQSTSHSTGTSS
jgi:uncharacterized membrane protein YedE/YeeE